jgi:lysophospholipase L1-like esterase
MPKRISLPQLIEKIQNQKLTPQEAKSYFLVEPKAHRPFDFKTYINPEYVDVQNFESLALDADLLVTNISPVPPGKKKTAAKQTATGQKIVAEGDSWFRLPPFIYPRTCIDFLQEMGYPVTNLAHWGDTLEEMLLVGEFWPPIDAGADLLLFSAGGNDILGNGGLASFLNLFDVGHTKPADAPYYVRQAFYDNLDVVISNIETGLIKPMAGRRKKIIMHGYDYVIPRPHGPWLGAAMEFNGLDPTFNAALCQAIVRVMINAFNSRLKALASKYSKTFMHLDLRGTVGKNEWFDELHPKEVAARKIATKFAKAIDSVKVSTQEKAIAKVHLLAA